MSYTVLHKVVAKEIENCKEELHATRAQLVSVDDPDKRRALEEKIVRLTMIDSDLKSDSYYYKEFLLEVAKEEFLYRLANPMAVPDFVSGEQDEDNLEMINLLISDAEKKIDTLNAAIYSDQVSGRSLYGHIDGPHGLAALRGKKANLVDVKNALEKRIDDHTEDDALIGFE